MAAPTLAWSQLEEHSATQRRQTRATKSLVKNLSAAYPLSQESGRKPFKPHIVITEVMRGPKSANALAAVFLHLPGRL